MKNREHTISWLSALVLFLMTPSPCVQADTSRPQSGNSAFTPRGFEDPWILPLQDENSGSHVFYPAMAIGTDGVVNLVTSVIEPDGQGGWINTVRFFRSVDNGATFSRLDVAQTLNADSFPDLAVDGDRIAVAWEDLETCGNPCLAPIMFARSLDDGQTFSTPIQLATANVDALGSHPWSRVLTKGDDVCVFWKDNFSEGSNGLAEIHVSCSNDGGLSFAPPQRIGTTYDEVFWNFDVLASSDGNVYVAGSSATHVMLYRGSWAGNFELIQSQLNQQTDTYFAGGRIRMAMTPGGKLYVVWIGSEQAFPNTFVFLRSSEDGGETFGAQVLVDDFPVDIWHAREELAISAQGEQSLTIAENRWRIGIYVYQSTDGGQTFAEPIFLRDAFDFGTVPYTELVAGVSASHVWLIWDEYSPATNYMTRVVASRRPLPLHPPRF